MLTAKEFADRYFEEAHGIYDTYRSDLFTKAMDLLWDTYTHQRHVFIFGNGGSAGTSSHMANDLSKGTLVEGQPRLRVLGLTDNVSLMTAYANDCGYETIFEEQLKNFFEPHDLCIAISASGRSPNVVRAVQYAKKMQGKVIGLVGFTGGDVLQLSDVALHFKSHNYGIVEDAQLMFSHLSSQFLSQKIKAQA